MLRCNSSYFFIVLSFYSPRDEHISDRVSNYEITITLSFNGICTWNLLSNPNLSVGLKSYLILLLQYLFFSATESDFLDVLLQIFILCLVNCIHLSLVFKGRKVAKPHMNCKKRVSCDVVSRLSWEKKCWWLVGPAKMLQFRLRTEREWKSDKDVGAEFHLYVAPCWYT